MVADVDARGTQVFLCVLRVGTSVFVERSPCWWTYICWSSSHFMPLPTVSQSSTSRCKFVMEFVCLCVSAKKCAPTHGFSCYNSTLAGNWHKIGRKRIPQKSAEIEYLISKLLKSKSKSHFIFHCWPNLYSFSILNRFRCLDGIKTKRTEASELQLIRSKNMILPEKNKPQFRQICSKLTSYERCTNKIQQRSLTGTGA